MTAGAWVAVFIVGTAALLFAIKTVQPTKCKACGRTFPSPGALDHHFTVYHLDN